MRWNPTPRTTARTFKRRPQRPALLPFLHLAVLDFEVKLRIEGNGFGVDLVPQVRVITLPVVAQLATSMPLLLVRRTLLARALGRRHRVIWPPHCGAADLAPACSLAPDPVHSIPVPAMRSPSTAGTAPHAHTEAHVRPAAVPAPARALTHAPRAGPPRHPFPPLHQPSGVSMGFPGGTCAKCRLELPQLPSPSGSTAWLSGSCGGPYGRRAGGAGGRSQPGQDDESLMMLVKWCCFNGTHSETLRQRTGQARVGKRAVNVRKSWPRWDTQRRGN